MTTRVTYSGDDPDFRVIRSVFRDVDGPVGRLIDAKSRLVLAEAQRRVPVRTGRLLASLRREYGVNDRGPYWEIHVGVPGLTSYLQYVLFGAPPHIIRPRRRKALRFIGRRGLTFARVVHHPGQRGSNFLVDALRAAR